MARMKRRRRDRGLNCLLNSWSCFIALLIVQFFTARSEISDDSWHIGCFLMTNDGVINKTNFTNFHATENPVSCCQMCLDLGYSFAAVRLSDCVCVANLSTEAVKLSLQSCNNTCSYNVSSLVMHQNADLSQALVLPCGSDSSGTVSVYRSGGPYLNSLSLSVADSTIYVGQAFVITIDVSFATSPDVQLNFGTSAMIPPQLVYIQSFCDVSKLQMLQVTNRTLSAGIICILELDGNYSAHVTASNILSELSANISFVVLNPTITELKVFLLSDQVVLPSCLPEADLLNGMRNQMVFEGIVVRFEASAQVCCESIIFNWTFKDANDNIAFNTLQDGVACHDGQLCSISIQEYIFPTNGSYSVVVTATNNRSEATDRIELMVVTPGIRSVSLDVVNSAVLVGDEVDFNVSAVTVILPKVTLILDFGDGSKRHLGFHNINQFGGGVSSTTTPGSQDVFNYTTKDTVTLDLTTATTATTAVPVPDWEELEMMGTFKFTEDCQILLTLEHVYLQEGVYFPTLSVSDGFSNVSASLGGSVTVSNPLQHISVNHSLVDAVNRTVIFSAEADIHSAFLSFHWTIFYNDLLIFENVSRSSVLRYVFSEAGSYEITVNASTPLEFAVHSSRILIELPVVLLDVSCRPVRFVAVHEVLNCSASVGNGTNVNFHWNFHDSFNSWIGTWNHDLYSNARHRFYLVGEYVVSVRASNSFNQLSVSLPFKIVVLEPVYNLWTLLPRPVLLGRAVEFVTQVGSGSKFVLWFYFGDSSDAVIVNATSAVNVTLSHVYAHVGTYHVKVSAQNEVSVLHKEFDVEIVEDFSLVDISLVGSTAVVGRRAPIVVYVDNKLSNRNDLLYNWTKNAEILLTTQSPVIELAFDSADLYNISVIVYNMVVSKSDWMIVNVSDDNHLGFSIGFDEIAVAFGYASILNINNFPCEKLTIDFGDNSTEAEVNSTGLEMRLEHFYGELGAYIVVATCDYNEQDLVAMTAVTVQQPMTDVVLIGPQIPMMSMMDTHLEEYARWQADALNGSNIVYHWTIDDVTVSLTAKNKVYLASSFGQHVLTVTATNGLGVLSTNVSFLAQGPIISVSVTIYDVALGADTRMLVTVIGDKDYNATCYFGDGTSLMNTADSLLTIDSRGGWDDEFPTDSFVLSHKYLAVGVYSLLINVTNHVSWRTANSTIRVHQPIGDIVLESSSSSIVKSGSSVVVTAITTTNYTLGFSWNSGGTPCPSSSSFEGNVWQSVANCSLPSVAGPQTVTVNVSNDVANDWKLANLTFMSIDPVDELVLLTSHTNPTAAAILKQNSTYPGNFYTDPVSFEARMDRGSDILCNFDFGDNSTLVVLTAFSEGSGPSSCIATHVFRKAGVYQVIVIASNNISSLSAGILFYVQAQPSGLRLSRDPEPYRTRVGLPVVFVANVSYGTNVSYTWMMGDGQVYSPAGRNVTHRYSALGCFFVNVNALNKVGFASTMGRVFVQDEIQSVELVTNLHLTQTGVVVRSGAPVLFTAIPHPDVGCLVDGYEWKPLKEDLRNFSYPTVQPHFNYTYKKIGMFSATVTARNALGSLTSEPLIVSVMDELKPVTIQIRGEMVINSQIEFDAYHFAGSSVTYTWNFGDNTTAVSTVPSIKHSFSSVGVFTIVVNASNAISQQTNSETIFVTKTFCKPPAISFLGPNDLVYWRSDDIRVEARVDINCSITNNTTYEWTVLNASSNSKVHLEPFMLHDPLLYLPSHTLPNGNYSVQLRVSMVDTIVYGEAKTVYKFSVIPSPLQAMIAGGLKRSVSYGQNIILDGSVLYDLDNSDFIYSWSCVNFHHPNLPCFKVGQLSDHCNSSDRRLNISGSAFRTNTTEFIFELNVSKSGQDNDSVQQMLIFQDQPTIQVSIWCRDCADHVVNSNGQLVFEAEHFDFDENELNYKWTLSDKIAESNSPSPALYQDSCFSMDGILFNMYMNGSSYNSSQLIASETSINSSRSEAEESASESGRSSSTDRSTDSTASDSTSTTAPGGKAVFTSSTTLKASTSLGPGAIPGPPRIMADENIQPSGRSGSKGRLPQIPPMVSSNHGVMPPVSPTAALVLPSYPTTPLMDGLGNGVGGVGEGTGRPKIPPIGAEEHRSDGGRPSIAKDTAGLGSVGDKGGPVIDQAQIPRKADIFTEPGNERKLLPQETTTGVNRRVLVINSNVLSQGMRYIVEVTVVHRRTNLTGTSAIVFLVNKSPGRGDCRMKPDSGRIEMHTEFSVYCVEWKDENRPISYEVNYRLSADSQPNLVYRGLGSEIKFRLPAGNPNNYSVIVEIAVIDSLGARSTVCRSPVTVHPAVTNEQILLSEVDVNGTIDVYIQKGRNIQARSSAFMIAHRLNRQPASKNATYDVLRKTIRTKLLSSVQRLPIRDMFEIQQTSLILSEVTSAIDEMNELGARYAKHIIQNVSSRISEIRSEEAASGFSRLAELTINGASNLIKWLDAHTLPIERRKELLSDMMNCIETLLLSKSRLLLPNVESVSQSNAVLSAVAARFNFNSKPEILLDSARLKFPFLRNYGSKVYGSQMKRQNSLCFECNAVLYNTDPFRFVNHTSISTSVVSVTMHVCNGTTLDVTNLPEDQALDIMLPNQMHWYNNNSSLPVHQLKRELLNVHTFTISSSDWQRKSLHIDFQFLPSPESSHSFPVLVYVLVDSDLTDPSPKNSLIQWDIPNPNGSSSFVVNLTAMALVGNRLFHLCVVERTLNAMRPRPGEVVTISYQLSVWWGQCLFWDGPTNAWSPTGCNLDDSSSYRSIHCRCNHLTSFAASIFDYTISLKQLKVSMFLSLSMNPVTCSFVMTILFFYFILLFIASKLDAHDARKLPVISLVDNSPKDRQRYHITLETGFRFGAGTSAKVSVVLHGEYGMSETRELISQTGQPLFERNSRDTFYMTFPESLGSIFKVQLWHDNSGPFPSWYLSRVVVKDACTGDIYYFVCEKWFAVEKEDGKVEREIMAADKGLSFSKILSAKSMQYLTDYHIWFSTLAKPSYSRFTRAQRLTCCLCLLMSYMAVSTAWYQYVGPPNHGEFNLIDISWQSIIVGMIVGVIVLPPTLLIIMIFRRSKVYRHNFEETIEEFEGNELGVHDRLLSDRAGDGANGLSVFEQTILSWQSLQEWAQRASAKHYQQSPVGSVQNVKPVAVGSFEQDHSSAVSREPATTGNQPSREPVGTGNQLSEDTNCNLHQCDVDSKGSGAFESLPNVSDATDGKQTDPLPSGAGVQRISDEESDVLRNHDLFRDRKTSNNLPENDVMEMKSLSQPITCSSAEKTEQTIEEAFSRKEDKRIGFRKRMKETSCNTSPSSSCFDSSPKEVHHPVPDEGSVDGRALRLNPSSSPLQPPSYGVIFQSPGAATSRSCSQTSSSNRSSVKSASSSCAKRTTFKKWRQFLPRYFVFVGWGLCALLISGCSAVTIYYGFRFSQAQSIFWLQSIFFSFLQCVFVSHPFIVVVVMVYSAVQFKNDMRIFDHYSDGLIHDQNSTEDNREQNKERHSRANKQIADQKSMSLEEGIAARQRSRYLRFARPPQEQRLIQARHQTMKEKNASALVNETVLFIGQFLLLVFIAFGKETETSYQLKASLTESFVSSGDIPFENLSSINQWWHWINNHFLEVMFSEEGYVDNCYIIGPASLRQLRIKDVECYIGGTSKLNFRCRDGYDQAPHDTDALTKSDVKYEYTFADQSNSHALDGLFGSYGGGGYTVFLNKESRLKAKEQLSQLQASNWTDQHTSAIILQLTMFHPQSNLFATVSLALELPPLGTAFTSSHISIVYLYKYITAMDNLVLACELLFFLATLLKIHHEIVQVLRHGINYLKNIWNVLEVSQCLLSLALIVCYTYRFLLIDSLVEKFRSTDPEEFVDVSNLAYWDMVLRSLIGFVLLLVNLQLVKGLRHHQPFARFANVYNHTSLDFVVFGCMFVIWLGAFISLGIALFGGVLWEMTTVSQALGYMTGLLECSYEFPFFKGLSPSQLSIWEAYTMTFLFLAYGSNAGYLLAFLTFHYRVFKDEPVLVFSPRENLTYYCQKVLDFIRRKPSSAYDNGKQQEIILPPEFTMAEIQYQVDEMLFKMNALAGTSNLPEKPAMYFTDSDTTCIGNGEEISSSVGSSGEGNFENWLHRMKDSIFRNDSNFAQLVNCDAQMTKQESNKQLMLQLEMEILRQLQGKRLSSNHPSESGTNSGQDGTKADEAAGASSRSRTGHNSSSSSSSSNSSKASASPHPFPHNRQLPLSTLESRLGNRSECRAAAPNTTGVTNNLSVLPSSKMENNPTPSVELNVVNVCFGSKDLWSNGSEQHNNLTSPNVAVETEFGNDMVKQLLVPEAVEDKKKHPVDSRAKWILGKVPAWTSSGSRSTAESAGPSPNNGSVDVKDIFPHLNLPMQMSRHPDYSEVIDDVFQLVQDDAFGFENEGYAVESSGEDSDRV